MSTPLHLPPSYTRFCPPLLKVQAIEETGHFVPSIWFEHSFADQCMLLATVIGSLYEDEREGVAVWVRKFDRSLVEMGNLKLRTPKYHTGFDSVEWMDLTEAVCDTLITLSRNPTVERLNAARDLLFTAANWKTAS